MKYVYDLVEEILYTDERFTDENLDDTNTIKFNSIDDFVNKQFGIPYIIEYDEKFYDPYIKIGQKEIPLMESISHRHEGFILEKEWRKRKQKYMKYYK